jgi:prephenate dehydrogenase
LTPDGKGGQGGERGRAKGEPLFERLAVLGLGLLGGSVAGAARRRGVCRTVVGHARRPAPLQHALDAGLVDAVFDRSAGPAEAVRGADLVVLATPVSSMAGVLREVAPALAPGALVTDVGSVKGPLADSLPGLLPSGVRYVGSHPMAGSHVVGVEHARHDLLQGACCVVTPASPGDAEACERLDEFWTALGCRVVRRDPAAHDLDVAWVSHLPHLLAFAYARSLAGAPERSGELAATGFRDFVRIARSDPEMWGDILGFNHKALAGPLRAFSDALADVARALEAGDPEAVSERDRLLESAGQQLNSLVPDNSVAKQGVTPQTGARAKTHSARSGGENPEIQAAQEAAATRSINRNS